MSSFTICIMACMARADFSGLAVEHFEHSVGDDLPRHAKLVCEPAALHFLATVAELVPVVVDFFLRLAVHDEGKRRRLVDSVARR